MKILLITNMYPSKKNPAFGCFVKEQVEELQKRGVKFKLVANSISQKGFFSLWKYTLLKWKTLIATFIGFDLIHAHYLFPTSSIALIPHLLRRKPLILTAHGSDVKLGKKNKLIRKFITYSCQRASFVITVSNSLAQEVKKNYKIPSEKIKIINCGVNTEKFVPQEKRSLRKELNLPQDNWILIFVGNLIPIKGLDILIEAFFQIVKERNKVLLIIIGKGQMEKEISKRIDEFKLKGKVKLAGFKPHNELPKWLGASDILILPSLEEGFGLVALEAMSCGLPVVASQVGGLREFIENEKDGFLVKPGNSKEIAEKVKLLINNKNLYQRISKTAREKALKYDIKKQAKKIKVLYDKLVNS